MAFPIGNQLGDEHGGIRIVMGLVVRDAQGGNHLESGCPGLFLRKACARRVQIRRQLHHARPQAARVRGLLAAQGEGQRPSGDVGGGAHGRPLGASSDAVLHQSAVARGVDVRQIGALVFVRDDAAPVHLQAGICQEFRGRADACRQDDHLRGQGSRAGLYAGDPVRAGNPLQGRAGEDAHAFCL